MLDDLGRRVKSGSLQANANTTVSTRELMGGTYTVRIRMEGSVVVRKLIVVR